LELARLGFGVAEKGSGGGWAEWTWMVNAAMVPLTLGERTVGQALWKALDFTGFFFSRMFFLVHVVL